MLAAARSLGPAWTWRSRLRDGQEGLLPAQGRDGQVPGLQRRRVRARDLQGPRTDAEDSPHADRGDRDRLLRGRRQPLVHLHPGRVRAAGRRARRGAGGSARGRLRRRGHPRLRSLALAGRAPRRRRLHLRRGDGPVGLAGRKARQPPAEAAVPRQPGPLPGPHPDQQRRDALHRPDDHAHGRRGVRKARCGDLHRHQAGVGLRARAAPRQLRDRAGDPRAGDHLRPRRRPAPRAARSSAGFPGAPPRRC